MQLAMGVAMVAWVGCSMGCASMRQHPLRTLTRVELVIAEASLACDWRQTDRAAAARWKLPSGAYQTEDNMFMGEAPKRSVVAGYNVFVMAATGVGTAAMPEWLRAIVLAGVIAVEAHVIADNAPTTGTCF